jgi:hypothetical protein
LLVERSQRFVPHAPNSKPDPWPECTLMRGEDLWNVVQQSVKENQALVAGSRPEIARAGPLSGLDASS